MKSIVLSISLIFSFCFNTFGQQNDWTKSDRSSIYDECYSETIKYKNLTNEQRESLSLCMLEEITSKNTKKEYFAKIEIEINRIKQSTITLCSKNLGLSIDNSNKPLSIEVETKNDISKINEGNFTRNDVIGIWRDENSKFFLNEDGTFLVKFDNGKSVGGKWWIDKNKQIILEGYTKMNIISFDGVTMKYMQKRTFARDEIYTAVKVNK
jgi:hypothetical protein